MTNSNDSNATRFLEIEEAATALIQQLQALESNVKSYSQVGDDLGKASQGLSEAASQYVGVTEQIRAVAEAMSSVGMPQLLDVVQEATNAVQSSHAQASAASMELLDAIRQAQDAVQSSQAQASAASKELLDAVRQAQDAVQSSQAQASAVSKELLDAVRQAQDAVQQSGQQTIDNLREAASRIEVNQRRDAGKTQRLVIIGSLLATAAGVTAAVLPLLNLS